VPLVRVLAGSFHVVVAVLVDLAAVDRHQSRSLASRRRAQRPARPAVQVTAVDVQLVRETTTFAFHLRRTRYRQRALRTEFPPYLSAAKFYAEIAGACYKQRMILADYFQLRFYTFKRSTMQLYVYSTVNSVHKDV